MVTSLFKHERIRTTDVKAKELRRWADNLITLAKRGDLHARRQALSIVREKDVVHKLFEEAAERYSATSGGYTRIVKLGRRRGDAAPISMIELIIPEKIKKKKKKKGKTVVKKKQVAAKKEHTKEKAAEEEKAALEEKVAEEKILDRKEEKIDEKEVALDSEAASEDEDEKPEEQTSASVETEGTQAVDPAAKQEDTELKE
jgi:large subunit ribosomal protein L17